MCPFCAFSLILAFTIDDSDAVRTQFETKFTVTHGI